MNKQEVINGIKDEEIYGATTDEDDAYNKGLDTALGYVEKLEVPKKAVLSKVEAEWLDGFKEMCWLKMFDIIHFIVTQSFDDLFYYDRKGIKRILVAPNTDGGKANLKMRLIRGLLCGYTLGNVTKLYTAKLKLTGEYLYYDKEINKILHHFNVSDDRVKELDGYHFTENDLVKYRVWEDDDYDIDEVE